VTLPPWAATVGRAAAVAYGSVSFFRHGPWRLMFNFDKFRNGRMNLKIGIKNI
jgi:hypothetical protein